MKKHKLRFAKQNIEIKRYKSITILFLILVFVISIVNVLARYVSNNINNFFLESREFYFYSDKLTDDGAVYQIDNWSGVENYNIVVNMYSRQNNLKMTDYDIAYEISYIASNNIICQIDKTEGNISAQTNTDSFNIHITPNGQLKNGDEAVIEIVAKSTTNYQKELKAQFKLIVGKENVTYQIDDNPNSQYLELNITNTQSYYKVRQEFDNYQIGDRIDISDYIQLSDENKRKCYSAEATISFDPNEVVIDSTDKNYLNAISTSYTNINNYTYVNKIVIEIDALSSKNIRFYKKDKTKDYTYPITNQNSVINVNII